MEAPPATEEGTPPEETPTAAVTPAEPNGIEAPDGAAEQQGGGVAEAPAPAAEEAPAEAPSEGSSEAPPAAEETEQNSEAAAARGAFAAKKAAQKLKKTETEKQRKKREKKEQAEAKKAAQEEQKAARQQAKEEEKAAKQQAKEEEKAARQKAKEEGKAAKQKAKEDQKAAANVPPAGHQELTALRASFGEGGIPCLPSQRNITVVAPEEAPSPGDVAANADAVSVAEVEVIELGLQWDFIQGQDPVDLDAACVLFDYTGARVDACYYNQTTAMGGAGTGSCQRSAPALSHRYSIHLSDPVALPAVTHSGDNRTGKKAGDDETISIRLNNLPKNVEYCAFVVSCYSGDTFENVKTARAELRNAVSNSTAKKKLLDLEASLEDPRCAGFTSLVLAVVYRHAETGVWSLKEVGVPAMGKHCTPPPPPRPLFVEPLCLKKLVVPGTQSTSAAASSSRWWTRSCRPV